MAEPTDPPAAPPAPEMTEAQWRQILTPEQFAVLRRQATEPPGTSALDAEDRPGRFLCAGCGAALFGSQTKYHSGSGWPSFWDHAPGAVATTTDRSHGMIRTEVHCARCGGHLGHLFEDGPRPTGLRYCINGLALRFDPTAK